MATEKVIEGKTEITVDKLRIREQIVDVQVPKFVEKVVEIEKPVYIDKETTRYVTIDEPTTRYISKDVETIKYVTREQEMIKPVIIEKQYERPVVVDREYERPVIKEDLIEISRIVDLQSLGELVRQVKALSEELPFLREQIEGIRNLKLVEEVVKVPKIEYITVQVERIEWVPVKRSVPNDSKG